MSFAVFEVISVMDVTHSSLSHGERALSALKFLSVVWFHPYFSDVFHASKIGEVLLKTVLLLVSILNDILKED